MTPRSDYYVYALLDPSNNNLPFYVGKGRGYRAINHYCPSYLKQRNYKSNIILKYRSLGFEDTHQILAGRLTEFQAFEVEIAYINKWRRRPDGGLLVNQTSGGDGASGFSTPRTPEWRAKIAAAHTGKTVSEVTRTRQRSAKLGRLLPDEQRQKISIALSGRTLSTEHKRKLSEALTGRKLSDRHREIAIRALLDHERGKRYEIITARGGESLTADK